ncbi:MULTISPECIES: hypothetical protein [unclassified Maribacter]|uniref:hypothetical protein n=1 Tax=unclassified Maribacter TaxID=2615042 RepID=UPI00257C1ED6|nr:MULTISPECIES: hypothetical protein [unclassified Maribacter]|tara:strand:- start:396 stop:641 length:246 start_codon:yes stop_codon:yes gene_type:complete
MGIYDFNILSNHEKYDTVFTKGQFVDSVKDGTIIYALYSISYFWVEVIYDNNINKILEIGSFVGGETLNKYCDLKDFKNHF